MARVAKVTISVPQEALETVDRLAEEEHTSRSRVITRLIERERRRRLEGLMAQGYKDLAEENRQEVEEFLPAQAEVVDNDG